jgi:hypothetical protein
MHRMLVTKSVLILRWKRSSNNLSEYENSRQCELAAIFFAMNLVLRNLISNLYRSCCHQA